MTEPSAEARERNFRNWLKLHHGGVSKQEVEWVLSIIDDLRARLAQAEQERDELRLNFSLTRWNELEASLAAMRRALEQLVADYYKPSFDWHTKHVLDSEKVLASASRGRAG